MTKHNKEKMITATQDCRGCVSYIHTNDSCFYSTSDPAYRICPCSICIVKVMCTKACKEFIEFQIHVGKSLTLK